MSKRILVCGGTGVVGSAIVEQLLAQNHRVRVLTRKARTSHHPNLEYVVGNVFDPESLDRAMKDCESVINAVQFDNAPFENPSKGLTYEKVDAQGTRIIVETAQQRGLTRIIYLSGAGVDADKPEPWFKAKHFAEECVRSSGMNWTIFRPSWIYGPKDRSLNRMIPMVRYSPVVFIVGKGYRIQPIYIDEVASMVAMSVDKRSTFGQVYELAGPERLTMQEILQTVAHVLGKKRAYFSVPKLWVKTVFKILKPISFLGLTPKAVDFITMDVSISENERKKTIQEFKIEPQKLEKNLAQYLFN